MGNSIATSKEPTATPPRCQHGPLAGLVSLGLIGLCVMVALVVILAASVT